MKRTLLSLAGLLVLLGVAWPVAAADRGRAEELIPRTGRVLISIEGDAALPAGEVADAVIVIGGDADIAGTVGAVTVIGGTATLTGAVVDALVVIDGAAVLNTGTTVLGEVVELNSTVTQGDGVTLSRPIRSLEDSLAGLALFMGAAAILLWIGFALATIVAGLALAGLAARQVRTAEAIIARQPAKAFLTGVAMIILPPLVVALLAVTLVGLPLALSVLFLVWPVMAFVGYLVAAIWIGEWLLRAAGRTAAVERPYLAAAVGLLVAAIAGFVPLVTAIISIFGLGAVTIAAWRTLAGGPTARPSLQPSVAPVAG